MSLFEHAKSSETEPEKSPTSVDFAAAQSAVERLTRQYPAMARTNLMEIRDLFSPSEEGDPEEVMQELRKFAHNFTGQGASFNFPLISEIADLLHHYLHACGSYPALRREVVEAYFDAVQEVLDKELSGDGGDEGRAILARLQGVTA